TLLTLFPTHPHTVLASIVFFIKEPPHRRDLPSFPTRRSSDLLCAWAAWRSGLRSIRARRAPAPCTNSCARWRKKRRATGWPWWRSEEHTSELQSRGQLVCRLLLEKKKSRRVMRNR